MGVLWKCIGNYLNNEKKLCIYFYWVYICNLLIMFLFFYDFVRIFYCKFCDFFKLFKFIGKIIVNMNSYCLISDCVFSELWLIFCLFL